VSHNLIDTHTIIVPLTRTHTQISIAYRQKFHIIKKTIK